MRAQLLAATFATGALAQSGAWGQCGGINYNGATSCVSGYTCTYLNDWYSQCIPGSDPEPTTTTTTTSSPEPTSTGGGGGSFKWFGVDESCAEFGKASLPGDWGTHFTFPDTSAVSTLMNEGYNMFRISFLMERLAHDTMTATFNAGYLANLTASVNHITNAGNWAVLDPHNFGRYYGEIITDVASFRTFWQNLAAVFKDNDKVVFDTNNEYHDMDQQLVFDLNQAAIDGVRAAGANSQYIFVEGNSWTGAWTWNVTNTNLGALTDPEDMIVYEMHQYLDTDGSGTHEECVSTEIGLQRVVGATQWLKDNSKMGILGEFAGGPNDVCRQAVIGMLDHLEENSDVWMGALWWASGPWWGDYMYSFEPPSGTGYVYYDNLLQAYIP